MERNSPNSQGYKLESQIREAYGRIVYTQTCHEKLANNLLKKNNRLKIEQIILSALTTGSSLTTIITYKKICVVIVSILSLVLLILNVYIKNFNLVQVANEHKKTANLLWKIREEYVSLLTDFEILDSQVIMDKRNELQDRTFEIYSNLLSTDSKSYKQAQKALKVDEEQTFSEKEIDLMLPNSIRRSNRKISDS